MPDRIPPFYSLMCILSDYNPGFKQAGFVPEPDDLLYLGQEQDLYQEIPQFLTAEFRQRADSFFDIGINKANAQDAYVALVSHCKDILSE